MTNEEREEAVERIRNESGNTMGDLAAMFAEEDRLEAELGRPLTEAEVADLYEFGPIKRDA